MEHGSKSGTGIPETKNVPEIYACMHLAVSGLGANVSRFNPSYLLIKHEGGSSNAPTGLPICKPKFMTP